MEQTVKKIMRWGLEPHFVNLIFEKNLNIFQAVFTTKSFDPIHNYEYFEQLGDSTINKFIVVYMGRRFPHLRNTKGIAVISKLRTIYGSKEQLSKISDNLGLGKFIRMVDVDVSSKTSTMSVLEDVFEALFGAIEFCIDKEYSDVGGMGYLFCYKILKHIFDDIDISLEYKKLVDAKTRLNEMRDGFNIMVKYQDTKDSNGYFSTTIFVNGVNTGTSVSDTKRQAQINASEQAIDYIEQVLKITKPVPEIYRTIPNFNWV